MLAGGSLPDQVRTLLTFSFRAVRSIPSGIGAADALVRVQFLYECGAGDGSHSPTRTPHPLAQLPPSPPASLLMFAAARVQFLHEVALLAGHPSARFSHLHAQLPQLAQSSG
jgi:hypothetical protein